MHTIGKTLFLCIIACFIDLILFAQKTWDLKKCIEYARDNNVSIKQQDIQERISRLTLTQSKLAKYPTVNFSSSGGYQFGRSVDPTTNFFTTTEVGYASMGLQSGVNLFNWFAVRNITASNKYSNLAEKALLEKTQNDVSLNVLAAYLQVLQSIQQEGLTKIQFQQTKEQLATTKKKVGAGLLPELNMAEIEAQSATDSSALIAIKSTRELNLLQLKALLSLDAASPFEIDTQELKKLPIVPLAELEPATVFFEAVARQPQQLADNYILLAAKKNTIAAHAGLFPSLSAFGGLQSGYSGATNYLPRPGAVNSRISYSIGTVTIANTSYPVLTTSSVSPVENATLFRQLNFNFRQFVGLSLNIPLFNGGQARVAWQKAKMNEKNIELQLGSDTLVLKQNIYQAYQNAISAIETYGARQKVVHFSQYAYELGKKRYEAGSLTVFELITLENNAQKDRISQLVSQFDYVFKMKILEFYKGNGISLQ